MLTMYQLLELTLALATQQVSDTRMLMLPTLPTGELIVSAYMKPTTGSIES